MAKYMRVVVMRKATFDVEEYKKVTNIYKKNEDDFRIDYIDDEGNPAEVPHNPSFYNIYVLGVEDK